MGAVVGFRIHLICMDIENYTPQQLREIEYDYCRSHLEYFVEKYGHIEDKDADTLIQGRKYPAKASIEGLVDQSNKVNFAGEVELLVLEPNSQNVEGLFEFTGRKDGVEYSIKHGFFRLRQNGLKYRE